MRISRRDLLRRSAVGAVVTAAIGWRNAPCNAAAGADDRILAGAFRSG